MENQYRIPKRKINDIWAIIGFTLVTIVMNTFYINKFKPKEFSINLVKYQNVIMITVAYLFAFFIISTLLLYILPGPTMHAAFIFSALWALYIGFKTGDTWGIIIGSITTIFIGCFYFFSARKNIKFCAGVCKATVSIIVSNLHVAMPVILGSIGILLLQTFIAVIGLNNIDDGSFYIFIPAIFHLLWLLFGMMYLVRVHASSVVSLSLLSLDSSLSLFITCFANTMFCLGSIFFAALLMALIKTAKFLMLVSERSDSRQNKSPIMEIICIIFNFIARIIISILEELVRAVNEWALVYMALYGTGYVKSIKGAFNMISENNKILLNSLCIHQAIFVLGLIGSVAYHSIMTFLLAKTIISAPKAGIIGASFLVFLCLNNYMEVFDAGSKAFLFVSEKSSEKVRENFPEAYELLQKQKLKE